VDTIKPPCYGTGTLPVNLFFGTVKRTVRNIFVKIGRRYESGREQGIEVKEKPPGPKRMAI
jgi:hypothetical protein